MDWEHRLGGFHSPEVGGYVAAVEDQLAGVVVAGADPDHLETGHITRFYVDAPHWGHRIGTLLYDAAISHLRPVGYRQASLWVLEGTHGPGRGTSGLGGPAPANAKSLRRPSESRMSVTSGASKFGQFEVPPLIAGAPVRRIGGDIVGGSASGR